MSADDLTDEDAWQRMTRAMGSPSAAVRATAISDAGVWALARMLYEFEQSVAWDEGEVGDG